MQNNELLLGSVWNKEMQNSGMKNNAKYERNLTRCKNIGLENTRHVRFAGRWLVAAGWAVETVPAGRDKDFPAEPAEPASSPPNRTG